MTVLLPDELQFKEEEVMKYTQSNGDWKPNTPEIVKEYKEEIMEYYQAHTEFSM